MTPDMSAPSVAKAVYPIPNVNPEELEGLPLNGFAVMQFIPRGVSMISDEFDPVAVLRDLGPLTPHSFSVVMTLHAAYERIRHLESLVRTRDSQVGHWEAEARAAAAWKNDATPHGTKTVQLKITQQGPRETYTDMPVVLQVYGEVTDERWFQEEPHKREGKYVLVQDLTCDSPIQTWPCQLLKEANEVLHLLGEDMIPPTTDGNNFAKLFGERAKNAIQALDESLSCCRGAAGLTDTDDVTLLERIQAMAKQLAKRPSKVSKPSFMRKTR